MPRITHDTPYREEPKGTHRASDRTAPTRSRRRSASRKTEARHPADRHEEAPSRRRSRRRSRGQGGEQRASTLTSHPTTRTAYVETRQWLLEQHGPVCAYCAREFSASVMTLDHVAPRRGQTAYDRRDNLVLACPGCNALKRDLAPMAFLLSVRSRAANLLRYGWHLSPMLIEMARSLAPGGSGELIDDGEGLGWALLADLEDGESPYRD